MEIVSVLLLRKLIGMEHIPIKVGSPIFSTNGIVFVSKTRLRQNAWQYHRLKN